MSTKSEKIAWGVVGAGILAVLAVELSELPSLREGAPENPVGMSDGDSPPPVEVRPLISIPPPTVRVEVRDDETVVFYAPDGDSVQINSAHDLGSAIIEAQAMSELLRDPEWYARTPENVHKWFELFGVDPVYLEEFDYDKLAESDEFVEFLYAYACANSAQNLYVHSLDDPSDGAAERTAALLEARKWLTEKHQLIFQRLLQADPVDVFNGSSPEEDFLSYLANNKESE